MIETNIIYNESNLVTLSRLPDNILDCIVCSPPYYGMRSYGTEPQPWGGSPECQHEWGEKLRHPNFDSRSPEEKRRQGGTVGNNLRTEEISASSGGQFCVNCNAWLGELGSEPTVLMFIDNLTTIFREVYRVMKPEGTCWVNLDDSYNSGGNIRSGPDQTDNNQNTTINRSKVGYVKTSTSGQPVRRKSMFNVPHRFAIAMTDEIGFIQRNALIWQKDSVSPESVKDRFTHEYEMFHLFVKSNKKLFWYNTHTGEWRNYKDEFDKFGSKHVDWYMDINKEGKEVQKTYWEGRDYVFFQQLEPYRGIAQKRSEKKLEHHDQLAVPYNRAGDGNPDGRNMRDVLRINTDPSRVAHYATYPKKLAELPIKAGCPEGGIVYDPFTGSGTTPLTAYRLNRKFLGSELQEKYHKIATDRLAEEMNKLRLFI